MLAEERIECCARPEVLRVEEGDEDADTPGAPQVDVGFEVLMTGAQSRQ